MKYTQAVVRNLAWTATSAKDLNELKLYTHYSLSKIKFRSFYIQDRCPDVQISLPIKGKKITKGRNQIRDIDEIGKDQRELLSLSPIANGELQNFKQNISKFICFKVLLHQEKLLRTFSFG